MKTNMKHEFCLKDFNQELKKTAAELRKNDRVKIAVFLTAVAVIAAGAAALYFFYQNRKHELDEFYDFSDEDGLVYTDDDDFEDETIVSNESL